MSPDSDDDQDVIEITDTKPDIRLKTPKAKQNDTPPSGPASAIGREDASNRSSSKRPTSQIIDLTLTDDEDYESVRPAKRQHTDNSDTPLSQRVGLQFNFPQRTRLGDTPSSSDSYEPC